MPEILTSFYFILAFSLVCVSSILCAKNGPQLDPLYLIKNSSDIVKLFPRTIDEMNERYEKAKNQAIEQVQAIIAIPAQKRTFENTILAFDKAQAYFGIYETLIDDLKEVHPDHDLRKRAGELILNCSDMAIELFQANRSIYEAVKEYQAHSTELLNEEQAYYFSNLLKGFKISGFELAPEEFEKLQLLRKQIAALSVTFQTNISQDVTKVLFDHDQLKGVDNEFLDTLTKNDQGYLLGCDYPTAQQVMSNCSVESTREKYYYAFKNRAFPQNIDILNQLINTRDELAHLLGYQSYAELDIAPTMAEEVSHVESFLNKLSLAGREEIMKSWNILMNNLPDTVHLTSAGKIKPWNAGYVIDQYLKKHLDIDHDKIAEYFPMEKTIRALLDIYEQFLDLKFQVTNTTEFWDPSVQIIQIKNKNTDSIIGYVVMDLFPRDNKYSHACCSSIIPPMSFDKGQTYIPAVALVIANFSKATPTKPSLLQYQEVKTFFHEFGHAIHAVVGRAEMPTTAAYNTKFDFVETPSQLLEEWMWDRQILKQLSHHYLTGESLADDLIEKLISTRKIKEATNLDTQLQYAACSLNLYKEGKDKDFVRIKKDAYQHSSQMVAEDERVNFLCAFGHLSGYASKYYTYLWSAQMAKIIFDYIKLHGGLLDLEMGKRYIKTVIGRGGSCNPTQLINDFIGKTSNQA